MINRVFHPIGQGAFYSENHIGFNIVYDCGSSGKNRIAENVVKQSFLPNATIDILFISHFDSDHVNRIPVLTNNFKIKNVILPLLHPEDKVLVINIYKALGRTDVATLIETPEDIFGNDTNIVYVDISETDKEINERSINIENLTNGQIIRSLTELLAVDYDWMFVPYNYLHYERNLKLKNLFLQYDLDIDRVKTDLGYALYHRNDIKKVYKKLNGGINENSMFVYSGSIGDNHSFYTRHLLDENGRVGCIYSGDADFNRVNIRNVFARYWDKVGTIQVPHHGDVKCYNDLFFGGRSYFCPISVGENGYGHPSSAVIQSILSNNSIPILVTEKNSSTFRQYIAKRN